MSFSPTSQLTMCLDNPLSKFVVKESAKKPNQFETFATSIDDMQKMIPNMEGTSNSHGMATELIKIKLITFTQLKEMAQSLAENLKSQKDPQPETTQEIDKLEQKIINFDNLIKAEETKFNKIYKLKAAHQERLKMPTFGTADTYNIEHAALTCPSFTDTACKLTLEEFWNKICSFTENENLSENGVKSLLSCFLHGPAYQTYYDNKSKPLQEIVQVLIDRFGDIQTIEDKLQLLQKISRLPGEKLASVMRRVSALIDKTKHIVDKNEQNMRYEILMTEHLIKLCSPRASKRILSERDKAARAGYILHYKNLFTLASDIERYDDKSVDHYRLPYGSLN